MIDATPQITAFIKANFKPSNLENATMKLTTQQLLNLLFNVFPNGSIDDYDLYQILVNLQYTPFKHILPVDVVEKPKSTEDNEIEEKGVLTIVWCLEDLSTMKI